MDPAGRGRRRAATGPRRSRALGTAACSAAEGGHDEPSSQPVVNTVTWWQNGGVDVQRRHPDRRPRRDDALRRHADLAARAHLLDGVHARRRPLHATSTPRCQPVHRVDAAARRRRQHAAAARRAGSSSASARSCSSATGGRRSANSNAALKAFLTTRTGDIGLMIGVIIIFFAAEQRSTSARSTPYALERRRRPHAAARRRRSCLFIGDHRQERPVPAAHVAARRHGRPHAGVRAHPRRHHGRRRRVPRRRGSTRCSARASRSATAASNIMALDRRDHDHHRRRARLRAGRHQEGARVLHDQPARLHGDGARRRRVGRARCSTSSPTRSSRRCCSSAPAR